MNALRHHDVLFLSGGGLKTAAFLGALDAIGIGGFGQVFGVSAGAVLAALLVAGYTPAELLARLGAEDWGGMFCGAFSFARLAQGGAPLDRGSLRRMLMRRLRAKGVDGGAGLRALRTLRPVRFGCFAADLDGGRLQLFSAETTPDVALVDALLAATAVPMCFSPVRIGGKCFVDAALVNNLPLSLCPLPGGAAMLALTINLATPDLTKCKLLLLPWMRANVLGRAEVYCSRGTVLQMGRAPENAHMFRVSSASLAELSYQGRLAVFAAAHRPHVLGLALLAVLRLAGSWLRRRSHKSIRLHG